MLLGQSKILYFHLDANGASACLAAEWVRAFAVVPKAK
jgi:hypothetical protein